MDLAAAASTFGTVVVVVAVAVAVIVGGCHLLHLSPVPQFAAHSHRHLHVDKFLHSYNGHIYAVCTHPLP